MIIHNQVRTLVETRYVYLQKQRKSKNTGIYYLLMGSSHFFILSDLQHTCNTKIRGTGFS